MRHAGQRRETDLHRADAVDFKDKMRSMRAWIQNDVPDFSFKKFYIYLATPRGWI